MRTIAKIITSLNGGRLPGWKVLAWSRIPIAIAANAMVGNRSKRPITAAPMAWIRNAGPKGLPIGSPTAPVRRNSARNARSDAIVQTIVWTRPTLMPSIEARSPRSAAARTAMPVCERVRNKRQRDQRERHRDHRHDVVGVEDDPAELPVDGERRAQAVAEAGEGVAADPVRDREREHEQELGEADRRDGEDQAGRLAEPADDDELGEGADDDRADDPDAEPEPVVPAEPEHEHHDEGDRRHAHVGGGEVDDPVGAVDERDAERDQRDASAAERAVEDDAERRGVRPHEHRERDDADRDQPGQDAAHRRVGHESDRERVHRLPRVGRGDVRGAPVAPGRAGARAWSPSPAASAQFGVFPPGTLTCTLSSAAPVAGAVGSGAVHAAVPAMNEATTAASSGPRSSWRK